MPCNIDNSKYLSGSLTISRYGARKLKAEHGKVSALAEVNFLDWLDEEFDLENGDGNEMLAIVYPWWYGERSGRTYEDSLPKILARTEGEAVILFVWGGGDHHTALAVKDGEVEEKEVRFVVED